MTLLQKSATSVFLFLPRIALLTLYQPLADQQHMHIRSAAQSQILLSAGSVSV